MNILASSHLSISIPDTTLPKVPGTTNALRLSIIGQIRSTMRPSDEQLSQSLSESALLWREIRTVNVQGKIDTTKPGNMLQEVPHQEFAAARAHQRLLGRWRSPGPWRLAQVLGVEDGDGALFWILRIPRCIEPKGFVNGDSEVDKASRAVDEEVEHAAERMRPRNWSWWNGACHVVATSKLDLHFAVESHFDFLDCIEALCVVVEKRKTRIYGSCNRH
jgi:hypothetical protein